MRILLVSFFITCFTGRDIYACSCELTAFCENTQYRPDDLVAKVTVLGFDDHSIILKNLEVLRGDESQDSIIVWDGTDFDCNGFFSMAASQIGNIGDTVLIILPKIDTLQNDWDILGDYRMPDWLCYAYKLNIHGDILSGYIKGIVPYYYLAEYSYSDFRESWLANSNSCAEITVVSVDNSASQTFLIYPNPAEDFIICRFPGEIRSVTVSDVAGNVLFLKLQPANSNFQLDVSGFREGIYLLQLEDAGGKNFAEKICVLRNE